MKNRQVSDYRDFRSQTDQSVQQLKLKWGDAATKLGSKGAGLLATFQQLKECSVHIQGLG